MIATRLRKRDLTAFRERLEDERRRLLRDARQDYRSRFDGRGDTRDGGSDEADIATESFEDALAHTLSVQVRTRLHEINHALDKMEVGTYGICEECLSPINPERLEARPWASRCVDCQQRAEVVAFRPRHRLEDDGPPLAA